MSKKKSSLKSTLVSYFKNKKDNDTNIAYNIKPTSREKKFLNYYSKSPIKIQPSSVQIPPQLSNNIIHQPTPEPTHPNELQKIHILPGVNDAISNLIKRLNSISFNSSIENKNTSNKIYNNSRNILRTKNSISFERIIKSISKLNTPTIINVPKATEIENTKEHINVPKVTKIENTKEHINVPKVTKIENVNNNFNKNILTKLIKKNPSQNKTTKSNNTTNTHYINKTTTPNHVVSKILNRFIENKTNNVHNSNTRPSLPTIIPAYAKGGYVNSPQLIMAGDSKNPSGGKEGEFIIPESKIGKQKHQDTKQNSIKIDKNNLQNLSTGSAQSIDKNTHLKMNQPSMGSSPPIPPPPPPVNSGVDNQSTFNSPSPKNSGGGTNIPSDDFFRSQTQYPIWRQRTG